jgi:hypothetical protein
MSKKTTEEEMKDVEQVTEEEFEYPKPEPKKKAYTVVLVSPKRIVYEVSKKIGYSTTPDIWNGKLKVGDTIYLEE